MALKRLAQTVVAVLSGLAAVAAPAVPALASPDPGDVLTIEWRQVAQPVAPSERGGLAAPCREYGCDDDDPIESGCADGSEYTVASGAVKTSQGTVYGTINLRYSPKCGTNWAQAIRNTGFLSEIRVCRLQVKPLCLDWYPSTATSSWSNQVYAYNIPAKAEAIIYSLISGTGSATA